MIQKLYIYLIETEKKILFYKEMFMKILVTVGAIITGIYYIIVILCSICWNGLSTLTVKKRKCPPLLQDKKYGTHKYITLPNQGIKMHYVEKGDPSQKLIIFVHGFPEFWFAWCHQIEELSKKYRTIALDLRGYGESDKPQNKEDYEIRHIVADIKEFIELMGRNCIIVSHDWGSVVCWELVEQYPQLVEKFVSINETSYAIKRDLLHRNVKQMLWSHYAYFFQLPYLPEIGLKLRDMIIFKQILVQATDEELECYKYTYGKPGGFTYPVNYYRALPAHKPRAVPKKITVPSLVIWGMHCNVAVPEVPEMLRKNGDNIKVNLVKNGGHYCQLDEPEVVSKLIDNFIEDEGTKI